MLRLDGKLAEVILKRIRSQAEGSPDSGVEAAASLSPEAALSVSVREALFSDFTGVCAMNRRLGQGTDSLENWHRLWRDNPALRDGRMTPRIGWVLEASGAVVGFMGSIPLLYELEGRTLAAAATCRLAVEPAYRGLSHLLLTSFFDRKMWTCS